MCLLCFRMIRNFYSSLYCISCVYSLCYEYIFCLWLIPHLAFILIRLRAHMIYVIVFVCMYIGMNVCMCVCMYVYACMYACMYVCMYVCVCMYICMFVCMYACMYVCTNILHGRNNVQIDTLSWKTFLEELRNTVKNLKSGYNLCFTRISKRTLPD
jgi:hypothetical protein